MERQRDEQDERVDTGRDESALTAELERNAAMARKAGLKVTKAGPNKLRMEPKVKAVAKETRTWRVRLTLETNAGHTAEGVKQHILDAIGTNDSEGGCGLRITRIREVLE